MPVLPQMNGAAAGPLPTSISVLAFDAPIMIPQNVFLASGGIWQLIAQASSGNGRASQRRPHIANDEKVANLPSPAGNGMRPIIERPQMPRLEESDTSSPRGNESPSRNAALWDQYWWQIALVVAVFVLQTALIAGLLHERRRRQRAEAATRKTASELQHRMVTAGELSVSITHEVNQPLAGIVANANAGMRWLASATPDVIKAGAAFKQIAAAGHRASNVIAGVQALVRGGIEERVPLIPRRTWLGISCQTAKASARRWLDRSEDAA